ncbi:ATP-grasp domain-containing protein [uncultured Sunxiuqinia sp.]|uniref:ATP-grasp domain-containing protein n=1 Tax=uncultured Sunxiuqinia sp. TaxID=1573825 RepID=UPI00260BFFCF|nr:ATP-grasp domain-containing protein [uncultured Sunxiuqinia sp.]
MNILFTCAGRRHYLIDYFQQVKPEGSLIVGADMQSSAPAMALVDKKYVVPPVYAANYVDELIKICQQETIGAIISLNDLELPILSEHEAQFKKRGVKLIVSNNQVTDICFDKWKTVEFARQIGVETPKTFLNLKSALTALDDGVLTFPLVVKPRWGSASIGIEFPEDLEELKLTYTLLERKLFRSMLAEVSKTDAANAILIQEKIDGTEYGLDIFNDLEGNHLAVYVKEKLVMRAGETDKAVLRANETIESIGKRIGENLKHVANLDCDIFESNGQYYLLEMNPRFGGGYPFSQMSGANFPAAIYAMLNGQPMQQAWFRKSYNQTFAKCDILIPVE